MKDSVPTPSNERSSIQSSKALQSITLYVWVDSSVRAYLQKTWPSIMPLTRLDVTFSGVAQRGAKLIKSKKNLLEQLAIAELSNLTTIHPENLLSELEVQFTLDPQNDTIIFAELHAPMDSLTKQPLWLTRLLEKQSNQSSLSEESELSSSVLPKDVTSSMISTSSELRQTIVTTSPIEAEVPIAHSLTYKQS